MPKRAIILLHPGFEEMEAVAPIDLLFRAGVEVVQASTDPEQLKVEGRNGITLCAATSLDAVKDETFDAVILPGGPGIQKLRADPLICGFLRRHDAAGKILACICAAPLLLKDAGLIEGTGYTAHPSTLEELPDARSDAVVRSGRQITSRGAGTATAFALELVRALSPEGTAESVAESICSGFAVS